MARRKEISLGDILLDFALDVAENVLADSPTTAGRLAGTAAGAVKQGRRRRKTNRLQTKDGALPGEIKVADGVYLTPAPRK